MTREDIITHRLYKADAEHTSRAAAVRAVRARMVRAIEIKEAATNRSLNAEPGTAEHRKAERHLRAASWAISTLHDRIQRLERLKKRAWTRYEDERRELNFERGRQMRREREAWFR